MEKEIQELETHQSKLLEKVFDFTKQLAALEATSQHFLDVSKEREVNFNKRVEELGTTLKETIQNSVAPMSERISDVTKMVSKHEDILEKITRIQENQAVQLKGIQDTFNELKDTKDEIKELKLKIKGLEDRERSEADIHREKVKARWTFAGIIATGVLSIIGIVLGAII